MKRSHSQGGFTLMEMIVVLAVIGTPAALITPRLFPYIDEAKLIKAQLDVNAIAAGITTFYKDTGRWLFEKDGSSSAAYTAGTDAAILTSNPAWQGAGEDPYAMSGKHAWNGPYLSSIAALDPWGHSYMVNVASANPALEGANAQRSTMAISAGPDGELDTAAGEIWTAPTAGEVLPEDDDIVAVIK